MSTNATPIILGQRITPRPAQGDSPTSDLQNMLGKLVSVMALRKWFFIIPLLTGLIVALSASMFLPRRYMVSSIIQRQDHDVITKLITTRTPYDFNTYRKSLRVDMCGYHAMSRAMAQIGMTKNLPRDENGQLTLEGQHREQDIIESWNRQINVGFMETSPTMDLIQIRYVGKQPQLAILMINQLKDNYKEFIIGRVQGQLRESYEYFQKECENAKEKVSRMEVQLSEMNRRYPGVDPAAVGQLDALIKAAEARLLEREQKRAILEANRNEHERFLSVLDQALAAGSEGPTSRPSGLEAGVMVNPEFQQLWREIEDVRKKIDEEKTINGRTDFHPVVKSLNDKQGMLQERIAQVPQHIEGRNFNATTPNILATNPIEAQRGQVEVQLQTINNELVALDEQINVARQEHARLEEERGQLPSRQHEYLMLRMNLETELGHMRRYRQNVEEMERVLNADEEDRGTSFLTLLDASAPTKPSAPALKGVYFLSAVVGLALAVACTFLREVFDRSFRNPMRVQEALGIPVLGTVNEIRLGRRTGNYQTRVLGFLAFSESLVVVGLGVMVYLSLERPLVYSHLLNRMSGLWPG
ncbi:MAG: hypothetical protein GXY44_05025 [Phycisphaerales bacterium]|nr:hypothetical protein [Phycisphaerales bacterium]